MAVNKVKEYREKIANMFIEALQEDSLEWMKCWQYENPYNYFTDTEYTGINNFYLRMVQANLGFSDPRWITYNQITEINKKIKEPEKQLSVKGEHGFKLEFWFVVDETEDSSKRKFYTFPQMRKILRENPEKKEEDFKPVAKYYTVFNGKQVKNIPEYEIPNRTENIEQSEIVTTISNNMGVPIYNDQIDKSFYRPQTDDIHLPKREAFSSEAAYNFVCMHELAHSTGSNNRLNRDTLKEYSKRESMRAKEELVAEITSSFMGIHLVGEIPQEHIENQKAYVQGWASIIKNDNKVLFTAIAEAQKSANYLEIKAGLKKEHNNSISEVNQADVKVYDEDNIKEVNNNSEKDRVKDEEIEF